MDTYQRDETGKYILRLLFKHDLHQLTFENSRAAAATRLLEKRETIRQIYRPKTTIYRVHE